MPGHFWGNQLVRLFVRALSEKGPRTRVTTQAACASSSEKRKNYNLQESNLRPLVYETNALPAELRLRMYLLRLTVGYTYRLDRLFGNTTQGKRLIAPRVAR